MFLWKARLGAAAIHMGISLAVASLAALLVFGVWYPFPYREVSSGRELFILLVSVDVVLGPLITFSIFSRAKPLRELRRDLAIVGLIQLAALGYGLWTVFVARPVHLVFEIERFRVVHAADIPEELLGKSPPGVDPLPMSGPTLLAVRPFRNAQESYDATVAALGGLALSARPDLWISYPSARADVVKASKPVSALKARFPDQAAAIDAVIRAKKLDPAKLMWLPLAGRKTFWTAFIDPASADIVAFMPLDSF
jgi:hypothetical protein